MLLSFVAIAEAACPRSPALRDPDGEVTVLAQNLKFIATGSRRAERAGLLRRYLDHDGTGVDVLLLSEARLTDVFAGWGAGWCFYTQDGDGLRDGYSWAPLAERRPPGGLAVGIRQHAMGRVRAIGVAAGKRFRARPTSLAEGLLGRIVRYHKGWARLTVDDTQIVWSHTQASYARRPENGAGAVGRGRAGQFEDLASDLGRPTEATLLTGDLNLLAGFDGPRARRARAIDDGTVRRFHDRTGLDLGWFADAGTFLGSFLKGEREDRWDLKAPYDRVGVNEAFLSAHAGTRVSPVEIADGQLRLSDHLGLRIAIPFAR